MLWVSTELFKSVVLEITWRVNLNTSYGPDSVVTGTRYTLAAAHSVYRLLVRGNRE